MRSSRNRNSARLVGGLLLAGLVSAGFIWGCRLVAAPVPRQGWDEERWGPLVPHTKCPGDCGLCHVPERWDVLREDFRFDHEKETGHKLEGAHAGAACLRCHNDRGPVKQFLERGCGGCHVDPHEGALGTDCAHCHRQDSWAPVGLVAVHARTRFPLSGAHLGTACDACHPQARIGDFKGAPIACHLCHQQDLARAVSPDHAANGWVRGCERCHSPSTWSGANFIHGFFPLTGAHATADCAECHQGGRYRGTPRDCFSCHQTEYQQARNPDHVGGNFPTQCEVCHNTSSWTPARSTTILLFPSNLQVFAQQALTNDAGALEGLWPGLQVTGTSNYFVNVAQTNLTVEYAEPLHSIQRMPHLMNSFGFWVLLIVVYMMASYGYPIAQFFLMDTYGTVPWSI